MQMKSIILFLSLSLVLLAKPTDFSIIVDKPFDGALLDITQDYDREISAVGFSKDYKMKSNRKSSTYTNAFDYLKSVSNSNDSQITLVKVDSSANIIINETVSLLKCNEAVAVVKTPNNGYFIGGSTLDGSLLILKLDSNANVIFTKTFGTNNHDKMNNLILLRDGGVLAIGSSTTTRSRKDNLFETGLGLNDIYLTRFSKDGREIWSKKYGTEFDDIGIDAVEANDGSIVVISTTSNDTNRDVTFMRVGENGNKIWLKQYRTKELITPHKIIRLADNNFLVSLSQINDMNKEEIRLIKFDLQKNVLIDKNIPTTYSSVLNDIKEYSDATLIGVGYVKDASNTDGLVMLLDSDLSLQVQEHYGESNYDVFNAVAILNNSQSAVAGTHTNSNSQESNMWIVKLNRDATLAQKSLKSSDFYNKLCAIFKEEIESKLLSIKKDLSIELTSTPLNFKVSEFELTKEQKIFLTKFSKKLITFLHANQNFIETMEINGHTSSEWGDADFSKRYLKNEKLSLERSFSVLTHIFQNQTNQTQAWLTKVLRGSGYSYSKKIVFTQTEDREKSRRVSFKIILQNKEVE